MKFRTEITPEPLNAPIKMGESLLSVGSCFSELIAGNLAERKFAITINPTGVLFNPASIAQSLGHWSRGEAFAEEEFHPSDELWFHYELHGSLSRKTRHEACEAANRALRTASEALRRADRLLITFGTAWVYELGETGRVAANCHRQPRSLFRRRLLSVEEIVSLWSALLDGPLRNKRLIMTLSPIRHLSDGAAENSLSKATLRVALAELIKRYPQIDYFPAYELLTDDLRDYRFYGEDLVHPSAQAAAYIWEKFSAAALDPALQRLIVRLEALKRAREHRPLHAGSIEYNKFCMNQLQEIERLERDFSIDLEEEKAYFQAQIG